MTSFTKKVVKNYFCKFRAFSTRWPIFHGKPVIAPFQLEVVFYFLINDDTLVFEIGVKGCGKAFSRTRALLSKPEGMF
jgi:hypothetical protein